MTERREIHVPRLDQRLQKGDAVLGGHAEDIRVEELELEDRPNLGCLVGGALAQDQLSDSPEESGGLVAQFPLQLLLALELRQLRQLPAGQPQELVHPANRGA